MTKCDFCKDNFAVLNSTMEFSGLEFALMRNQRSASLRVRYYPDHAYTTFKTQDFIPIEYCPKCGRRLKEGTVSILEDRR